MRPLFHPSVEDVTVEAILHALSDPVRVAIYADIVGSACSQNCSTFLSVSNKAIPKSTLSQHFKALREAGLIRSERRGVEISDLAQLGRQRDQHARLAPPLRIDIPAAKIGDHLAAALRGNHQDGAHRSKAGIQQITVAGHAFDRRQLLPAANRFLPRVA